MKYLTNVKAIGKLLALNVLAFGVLAAAGESMQASCAVVAFAGVFFQLVSKNFRQLCSDIVSVA